MSRAARVLRVTAIAAGSACAIGLLALLYDRTQSVDPATGAAVQDTLRRIHQLDSDWNVAIMSAKVGLQDSYDPLVGPQVEIARTLERLDAMPGAADALVAPHRNELRRALAAKADLVEQFKSRNSILRNSLRYLPTAAEAAQAAAAQARAAADLRERTDRVLEEALKFAVAPDSGQRAQLATRLADLEAAVQESLTTDAEAEPVRLFLGHAHTVLRHVTEEAGMLERILASPTVAGITRATAAWNDLHGRMAAEAELWRRVLIAYSAALLLLVAYTGWRLRQSFRQIGRMNRALVKANSNLEERVQARTAELRQAMASLRESELQLIQSEKMSSLGQMVAGLVHEINTPLAYVRSGVETVRDELEPVASLLARSDALVRAWSQEQPDEQQLATSFAELSEATSALTEFGLVEELGKLAGEAVHGLDQIGEIVANLKNFSRLDRSKTAGFDLREGLESTLVIARSTLKGHRVVKRFEQIPQVVCAPSQLNQVFLNLVTNAAQALPAEGGTITLSTREENGVVRVDVADDGCGIPQENLDRIFDPFFTTKAIGQGTGLGLSIAYKIVQEHQGTLSVQSAPGRGTVFTVRLPLAIEPALAEAVPA